MKKHERKEEIIICLVCPLACQIKLIIDDEGNVKRVVGAECDKGKEYALKEYTWPERVLTATVRTIKSSPPLLSVRTNRPIPKKLLMKCMGLLAEIKVEPPVKMGEVILSNVLNSGADVIATQELRKNEE